MALAPKLIFHSVLFLNVLGIAVTSALQIRSICTHSLLPLPATFMFLPQIGVSSRRSTFLKSSIDIFDILPLSKVYDRLHCRVLVNGSSSTPWATYVHEAGSVGDAWNLWLLLDPNAPPYAHLRVVFSLSQEKGLEEAGCVEEVESIVVPACVLDIWVRGTGGIGGVEAVMVKAFESLPLSTGPSVAATPSCGARFLAPVSGSSFSSSMPLVLLLHVESFAIAPFSRWILQV
jgi:hypothetical protein